MFHGRTFALLTQHGKQTIMAPILKEQLGVNLVLAYGFNTDLLGTFSNEIERTLSPAASALRKATLACELSGHSIGLGSEGSFSTGFMGFVTINSELVTCFNKDEGWHVTGHFVGPSSARAAECKGEEELQVFLKNIPSGQRLILQTNGHIAKGLESAEQVLALLSQLKRSQNPFPLTISDDLRAHYCPARREHIALATQNLVDRLSNRCPACKRVGFWPDKNELGLPCRDCLYPTTVILSRRAICASCQYEQVYPQTEAFADPEQCPICNP